MKKLILILLQIFTCYLIYAQSEYYNAITLRKNLTNQNTFKNNEEVLSILKHYFKNVDSTYDSPDFDNDADIQNNPFINDFKLAGRALDTKSIISLFELSKVATSIGGLDVAKFADGLAKFLVERSKEELNVAFFRRFQEFIDKYPELQVLFPTTSDFLQNIYSYQYAAMLPALKAAFEKDLNAYCSNLINLRDIKSDSCRTSDTECITRINYLNNFLNNSAEGRSILGTLIVADNIIKGNDAAKIINSLANDKIFLDYPDDNISNIIQFTDLISTALRSKNEGELWISKDEIYALVNDEITFKIFLGLIYASDQNRILNNHHIQFTINGKTITFQWLLIELSNNWDKPNGIRNDFTNQFKNLGYAANVISDNTEHITKLNIEGEQSSILIYAEYLRSISEFLKISLNFVSTNSKIDSNFNNLQKETAQFIAVIDESVNSCYDIRSRNYGALILHTSNLLNEILGANYTFKNDYLKYGTFMANIVAANSSEEVKAAIEAAVLPVGSSSIKRETYLNISVNAYIGPYAGGEYLPKLKTDPLAFSIGLTAPVGIAISWGNFGNGRRDIPVNIRRRCNGIERGGKSWTIFVPLIDIGSIASFRLADDSSNVASDVTLSNIISPGLYLYYGIGKLPISIGLGGQIGPQLRSISATDIDIDKNYYLRFGFNIVVDIPFFNLYTKN